MKTQNMTYRSVLLSLGLGFTLMSCGASKSTDDMASRLSPGSVTSSGKPVAWCNSGASANYAASQKAYIDSNNNWNPQYGYVKFTALPQGFTNNNRYIQFYRWMVASDNTASIDATPLKFQIYDLSTNQLLSDWRTSLGWNSLASIKSATGMNDINGLFKRIVLKLDIRDVKGEYDVLRTAIYRTSDNLVEEQFDALIPVFNANPADYAIEVTPEGNRLRPQTLQDKHPLKGTSMSSSEYAARMEAYCDVFKTYN